MAKKIEKKQTWNEISGMMRVFGNEVGAKPHKFVKYSISIGKKTEDGEYKNAYIDVKFVKGVDRPEETGEVWLNVKEAFFSVDYFVDRYDKEIVKPILVITDCEIIE